MLLVLCLIAAAPPPQPDTEGQLTAAPVILRKQTLQGDEQLLGTPETKFARAIYVLSGNVEVMIEKSLATRLRAGEAHYFAPGTTYKVRAALASEPEVVTLEVEMAANASDVRALKSSAKEQSIQGDKLHALGTVVLGDRMALLLDESNLGHNRFSLTRITLGRDSEVLDHVHTDEDEIWLVLKGEAFILLQGQAKKISPGDAIRIPRGKQHSAKVPEGVVILQVFAPGGPEQRFNAARR